MSGFEWNKIFAALLLAALIAMVSGFIAKVTVHSEKLDKNVYIVAGAPASGAETTAPTGPEPIDALLASADVAAGAQTAKQCGACHSFNKGEPAKVGPNLWGIVGNVHAHMAEFSYSDAMQALHDKKWDYDQLNEFIYSPRNAIKGTKMTFAGLKDTKQRANVIAYLRTLADSPEPLPTVQAAPQSKAPGAAPQQQPKTGTQQPTAPQQQPSAEQSHHQAPVPASPQGPAEGAVRPTSPSPTPAQPPALAPEQQQPSSMTPGAVAPAQSQTSPTTQPDASGSPAD